MATARVVFNIYKRLLIFHLLVSIVSHSTSLVELLVLKWSVATIPSFGCFVSADQNYLVVD